MVVLDGWKSTILPRYAMSRHCIICRSLDHTPVFREYDIDFLRCDSCGHVFSSSQGDQDYNQYFGINPIESEDQFWWNEAHRQPYEDFSKLFLRGRAGRLLDVGCGLGYFVKAVSCLPAWEAFGYEISKPAVDFARNKLGIGTVFFGKVEFSEFEKESFDIITLWDVIEHIADPNPLLSYLSSILKRDGVLFIHTPNVQVQLPKARFRKLTRGMKRGVHYLEAKDHLNIYSPYTITLILRRNGFEAINFIHLRPIQSISGNSSTLLRFAKNVWFYSSVALYCASRGRFNLDNLFVIAKKRTP